MLKWLRLVFVFVPYLLWQYLFKIVPMSRNMNKYTLQQRWDELRKLLIRLYKVLRIDIKARNWGYLQNNRQQYIIVNHFSFLDPVTMIVLNKKPLIFVAKEETFDMIFVGRCLRLIDGIGLKRGDLRAELNSMKLVSKAIDNGLTVCIFPEGTRNTSFNGELLEFKAGAFNIAMKKQLEIVSVCLIGTQFPLQLNTNWKKFPVTIDVPALYEASDYENLTTIEFSNLVRETMQASVNHIREVQIKRQRPYIKKRDLKLITT